MGLEHPPTSHTICGCLRAVSRAVCADLSSYTNGPIGEYTNSQPPARLMQLGFAIII